MYSIKTSFELKRHSGYKTYYQIKYERRMQNQLDSKD